MDPFHSACTQNTKIFEERILMSLTVLFLLFSFIKRNAFYTHVTFLESISIKHLAKIRIKLQR